MTPTLMTAILDGNIPVTFNVSCEDLITFAGFIMERTRKETEDRIARKEEHPALSRKDAAKRIGCSVPSLDRAIRRGDLDAYKIGARTMLRVSDVDEYKLKYKKQ